MKQQITYSVFVPVPGQPAIKKPDIVSVSERQAKVMAIRKYGKKVIVVPPYIPTA